jgi:hypothetical protein
LRCRSPRDRWEQALRVLKRLERDDVFMFVPIPGAGGGIAGAWVALVTDDWSYQCQWQAGAPALWSIGAGYGRLTVTRIVTGRPHAGIGSSASAP